MKRLTNKQFIAKASEIHNNKYQYNKVEYKNSKLKVTITCPIHGDFEQVAGAHLRGQGCPKCYGLNKTNEEFIKEASLEHGNKYDYSKVNYTTNQEKVCIICPEHGPFWQTPNNHISKHRGCPKCSRSHGEDYIEAFLQEKKLKYIHQYKIDIDIDINSSGRAFIDFYIPELKIAIEYNGEQHYKPIKYFGGKLKFDRQVKRDQYVQDYCKKFGIKLIIIPYSKNESDIRTCIEKLLLF